MLSFSGAHPDGGGSALPAPAAARARAAWFGFGTVWCAALAHVAAGGGVPGAGYLLLIAAAAAGSGAVLGWLRAGRLLVAATMTGAQIFLHEVFRYWSAFESGTLAGHAGHGGQAGRAAEAVELHLGDTPAMPLWHAACGLLLFAALLHGEGVVRRLLSRLLPRLPVATAAVVGVDARPNPAGRLWLPRRRLATSAHGPRGPPVRLAA